MVVQIRRPQPPGRTTRTSTCDDERCPHRPHLLWRVLPLYLQQLPERLHPPAVCGQHRCRRGRPPPSGAGRAPALGCTRTGLQPLPRTRSATGSSTTPTRLSGWCLSGRGWSVEAWPGIRCAPHTRSARQEW